ncbi:calcium-binding and coiled-coil domain-containing protein 1b [Synchiropus splendidus]|uniref:calcium-binding and coiled-coil domain-containing protein 1b n=1 Tax=Synchiropus splendidus TaxID=270530 RepID=UPI00237E9BE7|nr:calcium-binding and coiled-coil domain-containing protein 1b [Synchiropus splendidus]
MDEVLSDTGTSTQPARLTFAMDKHTSVVFRNVGQLYFPQIRVECHYSLTSEHQWSSSDWIGIFKVGFSSIKQYHTYTWAQVPEGYTEGTAVNCCTLFYAFFLPRPSSDEYQFVYVDKNGKICAQSRSFTFCAPKPLEELETLKEERDEEEDEQREEEELLLVIPRAQLLQKHLEESVRDRAKLQEALTSAQKETERQHERFRREKVAWDRARQALKEDISELQGQLTMKNGMLKKIEGEHNDVKFSQENLSSELSKLLAEKVDSQQRITDLEDDVRLLSDREEEQRVELERLKERLRKTVTQMKHEEEKRKSLQTEMEASQSEVHVLQERLDAGDHSSEGLRRELRELGAREAQVHTELHQARLQVAQLSLQLSEENLVLREERASWAVERDAYKHAAEMEKKRVQELSAEVQRKDEWLQDERMERERLEVLLDDTRSELQGLKLSLRKHHKQQQPEHNSESESSSVNEEQSVTHLDGFTDEVHTEENTPDLDTEEQLEEPTVGKPLVQPELIHMVLSDLSGSNMW